MLVPGKEWVAVIAVQARSASSAHLFLLAITIVNVPRTAAQRASRIKCLRATKRHRRLPFQVPNCRPPAPPQVEKHYGIRIEYTFPDAAAVMDLVRQKGLFSFYEDGHTECCRIRKVQPLRRQLKTLKAWITGQRKDQSPGTRTEVPVVQVDPVFEGVTGGPGSLIKYNPLSNYNSAEVRHARWFVYRGLHTLRGLCLESCGNASCTHLLLLLRGLTLTMKLLGRRLLTLTVV